MTISNAGRFRAYRRIENEMVLATMPWTIRDVSPEREVAQRAPAAHVVRTVRGARLVRKVGR